MIIRCPQCEHARSVNESKIPPTAELATCPKCKHRFRFRTVDAAAGEEPLAVSPSRKPGAKDAPGTDRGAARLAEPASIPPGLTSEHPQSAVREAVSRRGDIWDAVDTLHQRWQAQMDQHVTEVLTPRPAQPPESARETRMPEPAEATRAPEGLEEKGMPEHVETTGTPERAEAARPPEEKRRHEDSPALEKAAAALKARLGLDRPGATGRPAGRAPEAGAERTAVPAREGTGASEREQGDVPEWERASAPGRERAVAPENPVSYGEGSPRPEERVERDMRFLRESPDDSRPTRNLGSLLDYPDPDGLSFEDAMSAPNAGADMDDYPESRESAVPWEHPAAHGWIAAFMGTLHGVMFRGPAFFTRLSAYGSLGPGYLFFLIMGYVAILGSLLWSQAMAALLPGAVHGLAERIALPVLLLLAPIALGLMLLFVAGFIRVILLLLAPEKSEFPLVYRVVSYSMAPFVLSIVPFVGPVIGAAWFVAALIIGCRNALGLSWRLAVFAPLPPAAMLLGGLVWYFL